MRLHIRYLIPLVWLICASCQRTPERSVLVELEKVDRIHKGTVMTYRDVIIGRVESVTLAESHRLPVAKVKLASSSPPLTTTDEFRVSPGGLLGDPFVEVIPAASPGAPLANGATVHAQTPPIFHLEPEQIGKMLGNLNLLTDLIDLPEPKRTEVLEKIRKLLDDAKKESTSK